jgi:predicted RNase H-like HicB family nuclease
MASHRDRTVLVYDHGLYLELAIRLSRDFGRVLYYSPWESSYPKSNSRRVGEGIEGIERVSSPWAHYDEIDLWVFPDTCEGYLQEYLANRGCRVWGSRRGEQLELDREESKKLCAAAGIDIGPYKVVTGLDALRKHLKKNADQWVKISCTRGDMETFHAKTYALAEPRLDELEHNLGAKKKVMEFIVEEAIEPAIETGYDGYCIDGRFPKGAMTGVEAKDEAYVMKATTYRELNPLVRGVNDKLRPLLKGFGYRGFISTEIRCTPEGKAYLIDPCARCGSPPNELQQIMIDNLADIMWEGSEGILVEPEFSATFGAQLLLLSDWADQNWEQVKFPSTVRDNIKFYNMTIIEGNYYVIPQKVGMPHFGAVVATGDTLDEAIEECKRIAEMIEGHLIDKPVEALDGARNNFNQIMGEQKPKSKMERKADGLRASGHISDKQYEKMIERS